MRTHISSFIKSDEIIFQWFNTIDVSGLSNIDAQTITKYRGDVAYREEQYESALLTFQRCRGIWPF